MKINKLINKAANNQYRPEIDGLRAIAVLSVILCHMSSTWLPGGFVGVDIFFVISGFLITKIIVGDLEQKKFSFIQFYIRRIRRILPAFFVVVFTSILVGWYLLLPKDFLGLMKSAVAAVLFSANLYFSREKGYFDISVMEKPLHHIWSLSVEEQFYFLWPVILFLFFGALKYLNYFNRSRNILISVIIPLNIILFFCAQFFVLNPASTLQPYYLLYVRAGELMLGGTLSLLPFIDSKRAGSFGVLGLFFIAYSIFYFNESTIFPGFNALIPCLGAGLILYYGQTVHKHILWSILSCRLMVFIGLLSYSLYLWHWPVLSYMRYVLSENKLSHLVLFICFIVTLLLSCITYFFVEQKTRYCSFRFIKLIVIFYLIPTALVAFIFIGINYEIQASLNSNDKIFESYGNDLCHGTFEGDCLRGDKSKEFPTVLVIGDSHAAQLNYFIDEIGKQEGWLGYVITASSCPALFNYNEKVLVSSAQKPCAELNHFFEKRYLDFDYIILAGRWQYQLGMMEGESSDPRFRQKFKSTLDKITRSRPVYVLSQVPGLNLEPLRAERFSWIANKKDIVDQRYILANQEIKRVVTSVNNAHYIDLIPLFSSFEKGFLYEKRSIFFDNNHMNVYGARTLAKKFEQKNRLLPVLNINP